jgi:hypothetical protein
MPDFNNLDSGDLTLEDLTIVLDSKPQIASLDRPVHWVYESRRHAQEVLDFLFLGPSSVARDHDWLRAHGITMILVARDARVAQRRLMSVDKAAVELGIEAEYVDVNGPMALIASFPETVRRINNHLVRVYRSQANSFNEMTGEKGQKFRRGRILVVCETGNDRSAAVVAAYIMSMFGTNMIGAIQFVSVQRFCASFDEDAKRLLQSWEDILTAQKHVATARREEEVARLEQQQLLQAKSTPGAPAHQLTALAPSRLTQKRGIEDTYEREEVATPGQGYDHFVLDIDRYQDRGSFVPFVDVPVSERDGQQHHQEATMAD